MKFNKLISTLSIIVVSSLAAPGVYAGELSTTRSHRFSSGQTDTYLNITSRDSTISREQYNLREYGSDNSIKIEDENYTTVSRYEPAWRRSTITTNGKRDIKSSSNYTKASLYGERVFGSENTVSGSIITSEKFGTASSTTSVSSR